MVLLDDLYFQMYHRCPNHHHTSKVHKLELEEPRVVNLGRARRARRARRAGKTGKTEKTDDARHEGLEEPQMGGLQPNDYKFFPPLPSTFKFILPCLNQFFLASSR